MHNYRSFFLLLFLCSYLSGSARQIAIFDVWETYDAFNRSMLDSSKYIYKTDASVPAAIDRFHGAAAIWCQPTYWDMAMNAYQLACRQKDRARSKRYKTLCERLFAGNKAQYAGFNFDDNNENTGWFIYDDIQWWTITLARAYQLFGKPEYLRLAEASFERVWSGSVKVGDTGSYADPAKGLGGGMFWQWQPIRHPRPNQAGDGKMACINFPTVVAALTLAEGVPKKRRAAYLAKGKEIYAWAVGHLFDPATGRVADNCHGSAEPDWTVHVYNQGTFIGASVLLYKATGEKAYLENAIRAADYTVEKMSAPHGVLPYEWGIEQGIYTAIFAQYMAMLVYDAGQRQYIPFLQHSAVAERDNPTMQRDSYSASGAPALMLLFPAE